MAQGTAALAYRHQRVQRLRRLVARRAAREDEGRFVLEGVKLLEEALAAGLPVEAVFVESGLAGAQGAGPGHSRSVDGAPDRLRSVLDRCFALGTRVFELQPGVLPRVAGTVSPQPVLAIASMPAWSLPGVKALGPRLVVVCVGVRDPGNAGTVARSAQAAGADAVVCCEGTVDMWNPKAVRASAGAALRIPVIRVGPAPDALDEIGALGLRRWAAVSRGGEDYTSVDLSTPCALVLGNEASGLPLPELGPHVDGLLSVPMAPGAESLNVGTAAAVICFEAARQRHGASGGQELSGGRPGELSPRASP